MSYSVDKRRSAILGFFMKGLISEEEVEGCLSQIFSTLKTNSASNLIVLDSIGVSEPEITTDTIINGDDSPLKKEIKQKVSWPRPNGSFAYYKLNPVGLNLFVKDFKIWFKIPNHQTKRISEVQCYGPDFPTMDWERITKGGMKPEIIAKCKDLYDAWVAEGRLVPNGSIPLEANPNIKLNRMRVVKPLTGFQKYFSAMLVNNPNTKPSQWITEEGKLLGEGKKSRKIEFISSFSLCANKLNILKKDPEFGTRGAGLVVNGKTIMAGVGLEMSRFLAFIDEQTGKKLYSNISVIRRNRNPNKGEALIKINPIKFAPLADKYLPLYIKEVSDRPEMAQNLIEHHMEAVKRAKVFRR